MACEDLQKKVDAANKTVEEIQSELKDPTNSKDDIQNLTNALKNANLVLSAAERDLAACNALTESRAFPAVTVAKSRILGTDFVNPVFSPVTTQWNQSFRQSITLPIIGTYTGFPYIGKEWTQVLAPDDEYDSDGRLVAASGWVVPDNPTGDERTQHPFNGAGDFPFGHPWGDKPYEFDFEFELALDHQYQSLLGPGNKGASDPSNSDLYSEFVAEQCAVAFTADPADGAIDASSGLLGVEWESNNIPTSFRDNVHAGDRTVVAGRWIVDCGHSIARTEIHPPLMLACASSPDALTTKVLFTSRPFLVGQTYTTDFPSIYVDGRNDDGEFSTHMVNELEKVNDTFGGIPLKSKHLEAHPKIKSRPFKGNPQVRFIIRPPADPHLVVGQMSVSFQFSVRSGVSIQITQPDIDRVDVLVTMNEAEYKPPDLPACNHRRNYQKDELKSLNSAAASAFTDGSILSALVQSIGRGTIIGAITADKIIARGIYTDHYDALDVNILDSSNQATNIFGDATAGIVHDDSQPFPFFGWLQAQWIRQPAKDVSHLVPILL